MESFYLIENGDGTYHIECLFVVYREKFGHHPTYLPQDEFRGAIEGFLTQFYFLVEDDLDKENAEKKLKEYSDKYTEQIRQIENDDTLWDSFPFKDCPIVYSK